MPKRLPLFYSALLLTGVNLLLRLVSTSFQVHISARLGAEGVGLLQLVLSVGGLSLTAGMAGIRTATMYLTAGELGRSRPGNVHWVLRGCIAYSLVCSSAAALTVWFAAPYIASGWIGEPRVTQALRLYALFLPTVCLSGCMTGYFTAANRIGTLAVVEIFEQLCYMACTMALLQFWADNEPGRACRAVVLGSGVSACFTAVCLGVLRLRSRPPVSPRIPVRRQLLDTALPLALADDLKSGITTAENLMVPRRLALYPGELTPLATFGVVCGMVFPVLMFPAAILFALAELLIPELARCAAAGSRERIAYLSKRSLKVALLYGCLCGGLLFLLARPLCMTLYANTEAGNHLRLYSLLVPMLYCDAMVDATNKGLGQQKLCVRYNILTATIDVIFLFLLLPEYGMHGYFFSFLISHLVNFILSLRLLLRTAEIRIPFHIPALSCAATLASAWGAGILSGVTARFLAFAALYGSLLTLFGVVKKEDMRWLRGLLG